MKQSTNQPICLITGGSGFLGASLVERLSDDYELWGIGRSRPETGPKTGKFRFLRLDLTEPEALRCEELDGLAPNYIVHAAALSQVRLCESQPERARQVNVLATEQLAHRFRESVERFIFCSTDLVFDGERAPYSEADTPEPISVYGRTKLEAERIVSAVLGEAAIVGRLSLLYGLGPRGRPSFTQTLIERAERGISTPLFEDEFRSPLYVDDAAEQIASLLRLDNPPPTIHLGGKGCSRYEMGVALLDAFSLERSLAKPILSESASELGPRPRDVRLDVSLARNRQLRSRSFESALRDMRKKHRGT